MAVKTPDLPEPPIPASNASDGDIREFYASYVADYISGPGTSQKLRGFPLIDQFQQGGDLTWWDLYCQDLKSVWDGVTDVFEAGAEVVTDYEEAKQSIFDLIDGAKAAWKEFLEGRDLEEKTEDGRKRTSMVVTLLDAQQVIENFRVGNIKELFEQQWQVVEDNVDRIKNGTQELVDGAAAYAGRPSASGLAAAGAALNQLQQASNYISDICEALLEIIKAFDIFSAAEDSLEEKTLTQGNPVETVDPPRTRSRKP